MTSEPIRAKIRRLYVPNAYYFITCVLEGRRPLLADEANMTLFRETLRQVKIRYSFIMRAYVFLHDHFHLLIFVPETTNISDLMKSAKWNFTLNYRKAQAITTPTKLWQRGFWDHVIRDERDFLNHFHYIHYNPVKHGYATCPIDYPHSSFHEYLRQGWYDTDWGCQEPQEIASMTE